MPSLHGKKRSRTTPDASPFTCNAGRDFAEVADRLTGAEQNSYARPAMAFEHLTVGLARCCELRGFCANESAPVRSAKAEATKLWSEISLMVNPDHACSSAEARCAASGFRSRFTSTDP